MRKLLLLTLLSLFALSPLAACGKIGSPALPPGEKAIYPRTYPSDNAE